MSRVEFTCDGETTEGEYSQCAHVHTKVGITMTSYTKYAKYVHKTLHIHNAHQHTTAGEGDHKHEIDRTFVHVYSPVVDRYTGQRTLVR